MGGSRVGKASQRIRTYGSYDELGAHLGLAAARSRTAGNELAELLRRLENELFIAQSELATPPGRPDPGPRIVARHVERLESDIDTWSARSPRLSTFVLAGGSELAAQLHVCRTVARRAERELWALHDTEPQRPELLQWANRLSDLLFALALASNARAGIAERAPDYTV